MIEIFLAITVLVIASLVGLWLFSKEPTTIAVTSTASITDGQCVVIGGQSFRIQAHTDHILTFAR